LKGDKINRYDTEYIDREEQEIMESIEGIDVKKLKKPEEQKQRKIKEAAKAFIKKETKMNIRIDPDELEKIKEYASKERLRYQTFIKSVLHKYITGQLIEKDKIVG